MPRIAHDPGAEVCPDFNSPVFNPLCETIANARQISHEDVTLELSAAWIKDNRLRVIAWQRQQAEDEQAIEDAIRLAQEADDRESTARARSRNRETQSREEETQDSRFRQH
jgi:hypothetical protein